MEMNAWRIDGRFTDSDSPLSDISSCLPREVGLAAYSKMISVFVRLAELSAVHVLKSNN